MTSQEQAVLKAARAYAKAARAYAKARAACNAVLHRAHGPDAVQLPVAEQLRLYDSHAQAWWASGSALSALLRAAHVLADSPAPRRARR